MKVRKKCNYDHIYFCLLYTSKLRIMIVYYPEINEYNGVESVQVSFEIISKTGGWHMFGGKKAKELEEELLALHCLLYTSRCV